MFRLLIFFTSIFYCAEILDAIKPNILIIVVDHLGWGDIGANNPLNSYTPYIDKLAKNGTNFLDFHSGANIGGPSMAALLTGRFGQRTGVRKSFKPESVGGLPLTERTIADYLKEFGYKTGFLGVWELGHTSLYHPLKRGFDYFYGTPYSPKFGYVRKKETTASHFANTNNETGVPLMENDRILEQPMLNSNLSSRVLIEKTIGFIKSTHDKPFLLLVAPGQNVSPQLFIDDKSRKCALAQVDSREDFHMNTVKSIDDLVRQYVELLDELVIDNNTMFLFTSTSGPLDTNCELSGSVGPFLGLWERTRRGGGATSSGTNWEGGHRVPMVFYYPGHGAANMKNRELHSGVDILTTIANITNLTLPSDRDFDGITMNLSLDNMLHTDNNAAIRTLYLLEGDTADILAFRHGSYKVFYRSNGAAMCNDSTLKISKTFLYHDPPLVFNLRYDKSEFFPISLNQNQTVLFNNIKNIGRELSSHGLVSQVNLSENDSVIPCCNVNCSCNFNEKESTIYNLLLNAEVLIPLKFPKQQSNNPLMQVHFNDNMTIDVAVDTGEDHLLPLYGMTFVCFIGAVLVVSVFYRSYNWYLKRKIHDQYQPIIDLDEKDHLVVTQIT